MNNKQPFEVHISIENTHPRDFKVFNHVLVSMFNAKAIKLYVGGSIFEIMSSYVRHDDYATVSAEADRIIEFLKTIGCKVIRKKIETPIQFLSHYLEPHQYLESHIEISVDKYTNFKYLNEVAEFLRTPLSVNTKKFDEEDMIIMATVIEKSVAALDAQTNLAISMFNSGFLVKKTQREFVIEDDNFSIYQLPYEFTPYSVL